MLDDAELRAWFWAHGADANIENHHGTTPLEVAILQHPIAVAQELIDHGALPKTDNSIHYAAEIGDVQKIELLINAGADVNALEQKHKLYRPMHPVRSVLKSAPSGSAGDAVREFLLANGADPKFEHPKDKFPHELADLIKRGLIIWPTDPSEN